MTTTESFMETGPDCLDTLLVLPAWSDRWRHWEQLRDAALVVDRMCPHTPPKLIRQRLALHQLTERYATFEQWEDAPRDERCRAYCTLIESATNLAEWAFHEGLIGAVR